MVVEYKDNKIIYNLDINEEVNDILMHISSLKTIKINRIIKGIILVSAFYSYLFNISFAQILLLLSIGCATLGLSVEKFQSVFMKAIINNEKRK